VLDAHDLHAWTITSGLPVLSVHVVVEDAVLSDQGGARVLDRLGRCLGEHFDVEHCTFQLEPLGHIDHESHVHR
jgi:cobalt-zinc-cadmium efflux system protein